MKCICRILHSTYLTQVSCLLLVTNQKNISKEKRTKGVSTAKCITTYNFLGQNVCATLCISAKNYKESLLFTLKSFLPIVIFFQIILWILFWSQTKFFLSHLIHMYLINNPTKSWCTHSAIHGQTIGPIEKFISLKFLKFL